MAISFSGSGQYLTGAAPVTEPPFTMACWFKASTSDFAVLMGLADASATYMYHELDAFGTEPGDPVIAVSRDSSGNAQRGTTTSGYSSNTWTHAAGVWASTTSRTAYIDGGDKGTNATSVSPTGIDTVGIAVRPNSSPLAGACIIAEAGIWSAALTDDEIASLAKGLSPALVRPGALVVYWPVVRSTRALRGPALSATGAPTVADHMRVTMPQATRIARVVLPAAAASGSLLLRIQTEGLYARRSAA